MKYPCQPYIAAFVMVAIVFLIAENAAAQTSRKKVKLIHTDELLYDKSLLDAQRLIGHVQLEYEGTMFYSDSAYLYSNDDFDAFSNIRIIKPGSYHVTGDKGHFDKQKSTATLTDNVTLRDEQMTLTTNFLTFNTNTEIATYHSGGKIVSNVNKNILTSNLGIYHSKTNVFYFRKNVVLKNMDYTVYCDTMQYNNTSEVTYFFGPTTIVGDDSEIYCENGYYNTKKNQSRFGKNARVRSKKTVLTGDSIFYDGTVGFGEVFRNVTIRDTTENFIISGHYGKHLEKTKLSFVTGRALLTQAFESDTLFMHADTLKAIPDSAGNKIVYAYRGVKIFKEDIQGKCDSMVYSQADSTMSMFVNPVMWNQQNQITGDTILLQTANNEMKKLTVNGNAFIISDAEAVGDSISTKRGRYNQIKGKKLTGNFFKNELRTVYVEGNGQIIYFPTDDSKDEPLAMGHNQGECSNIHMTIEDRKLKRMRMETETTSTFSPMKLSDESQFKLEGFQWRESERPRTMHEIFR